MAKILVELNNVSKIFNKNNWAIKKVDLNIIKGETVALIGPNGGGKTVLGSMIANVVNVTSGVINHNFDKGNALTQIGYQFRENNWPIGFKGKDIVELYKQIYGINDEAWIDELIETFDMKLILEKSLDKVSTAWKQLFSLFLALLNKPELLVIDEIPNNIGIDVQTKINSLLVKCKNEYEITMIISSPGKILFDALCDRILVINDGIILYDENISSWSKDIDYEKYLEEITYKVKQNDVAPIPDPVFKPILRKFESKLDKLKETLASMEKLSLVFKDEIQEEKYLSYLKNIAHYCDGLSQQVISMASSFLSKQNIDKSKVDAYVVLKHIQIFLKIEKELVPADKKVLEKYNKKLLTFKSYLKDELIPIFKNKKIIIDGNEITAGLTKAELKELKTLKKRYISEELKYIKLESKLK